MLVHSQKKNSQGIKKVIVNNKLQCSNCKYLLDISNFYKDNSSATGYRSYCKSCAKRYRREKLKQALNRLSEIKISINGNNKFFIEKVRGGKGSWVFYVLPKETIIKLIDEVKRECL
ncbi:hypothetical protein [Aliarcobacter cryaerophilus]|uniref:hypothetical protein n=1 Tax=Aliarcobacter cryaerophilus TaxID=28198 RepID=UPI003DA6BA90